MDPGEIQLYVESQILINLTLEKLSGRICHFKIQIVIILQTLCFYNSLNTLLTIVWN